MHGTYYHHNQSLLSKLAPQRKLSKRRRGFSKRKTYQGFVLFTSSPPAHGDGDSCDFFETVLTNHILLRQEILVECSSFNSISHQQFASVHLWFCKQPGPCCCYRHHTDIWNWSINQFTKFLQLCSTLFVGWNNFGESAMKRESPQLHSCFTSLMLEVSLLPCSIHQVIAPCTDMEVTQMSANSRNVQPL